MDFAFVDMVATRSQNNRDKCPLLAVDFFSRFFQSSDNVKKYAKHTLQFFKKKMFLKRALLKIYGLIKEQKMGKKTLSLLKHE